MSEVKEQLHKGHRQRQKELFLKNGLDAFADHGVLELMLYYAVPRKDTNELAHRLINRFGTIAGVMDAPYEELMKIDGVGDSAATFLKLLPQLCARYYQSRGEKGDILDTTAALGKYLQPFFIGEVDEVVYMITMDSRLKVISSHFLHRGTVNVTQVSTRKIAQKALADNAVYVVLAHNHVGAFALPSPEDISSTKAIAAALQRLEIHLLDHLIFEATDFVSMRESGCFTFNY